MSTSFIIKKEIFDLQESHTDTELKFPNKNFFFNNYIVDIFLFVTASNFAIMVTTLVMYILYEHMKIKSIVTSLALQKIKDVCVGS